MHTDQGACVCSAAGGSVCPEYFAMLSRMHDQFGVAKQITDPLGKWAPLPTRGKAPKQGALDLWSDRLGGASDQSVKKLASHTDQVKPTTSGLSTAAKMAQQKANAIKQPHKGQIPRTTVVGYKWHTDGSGPHVPSFLYGYKYEFGWLGGAPNYFVTYFA